MKENFTPGVFFNKDMHFGYIRGLIIILEFPKKLPFLSCVISYDEINYFQRYHMELAYVLKMILYMPSHLYAMAYKYDLKIMLASFVYVLMATNVIRHRYLYFYL